MAFRTWRRLLLTALGVGVLAGAGQLGFAYGLGVVRFARTFDSAAANQWTAQLAWVSWFPMVAAVAGAVAADALGRRQGHRISTGSRVAFAAAAALGAAAVAPLCMLPARAAHIASGSPALTTGLCAALGAIIGFVAALAVLTHRAIGWNIAAIAGGIWLLALVSVAPSLGPTDPLPAVRLGVLDPASLSTGNAQRLAVVTMPVLALVVGAASGALARWRGDPVLAVTACGAAGPTMLALAYVTAGPGGSGDKYQAAPYWGALLAAGAGALGSVLATVVRLPAPADADEESAVPAATDAGPATAGRSPHATEDRSPRARADRSPHAEVTATGDGGAAVPGVDVPESPATRTGRRAVPRQRQSNHDRVAGASTSTDAPGRRREPRDRDVPGPDSPSHGKREPDGLRPDGLEDADPAPASATRGDVDSGSANSGSGNRPRRGFLGQRRAAKTTEPRSAGDAGSLAAEKPDQRPSRGRDRTNRPVPERDEEYVDWVSGLGAGKPERDGEADRGSRRSLRSSGRHHVE